KGRAVTSARLNGDPAASREGLQILPYWDNLARSVPLKKRSGPEFFRAGSSLRALSALSLSGVRWVSPTFIALGAGHFPWGPRLLPALLAARVYIQGGLVPDRLAAGAPGRVPSFLHPCGRPGGGGVRMAGQHGLEPEEELLHLPHDCPV